MDSTSRGVAELPQDPPHPGAATDHHPASQESSPARTTPAPGAWLRRAAWAVSAAMLLSLRLGHLSGPLDDPHSWRQCDTAHYSLDFFRRGIDLLHPAVCWLGSHRTLILEFPLPEAISALLYHALGPDPRWDRVVSLAFFVIATVYLFAF